MNKAEREYVARVIALGCIICGGEAELHHCRDGLGMGQRASHYDTLPLCPPHHRTGGLGVAFHAGRRTWEANFGLQRELLAQVKKELGV